MAVFYLLCLYAFVSVFSFCNFVIVPICVLKFLSLFIDEGGNPLAAHACRNLVEGANALWSLNL